MSEYLDECIEQAVADRFRKVLDDLGDAIVTPTTEPRILAAIEQGMAGLVVPGSARVESNGRVTVVARGAIHQVAIKGVVSV